MPTVFYALAASMTAVAVFLVLRPLYLRRNETRRPRVISLFVLLLGVLLPLLAIGTYALVGAPAALDNAIRLGFPASLPNDTAQLRVMVEQSPGDFGGWMALGQSYEMLRQPKEALKAYTRAIKLDPDNPDALIAWVGADSTLHPGRNMGAGAKNMLERAIAIDPNNQRGLWLLGVSEFQIEDFSAAKTYWKRLLEFLEPGSPEATDVLAQIALAEGRQAVIDAASPEDVPVQAGSTPILRTVELRP